MRNVAKREDRVKSSYSFRQVSMSVNLLNPVVFKIYRCHVCLYFFSLSSVRVNSSFNQYSTDTVSAEVL